MITFNIWCAGCGVGICVFNDMWWFNVFLFHHHELTPIFHRQADQPLHHLQEHTDMWLTPLSEQHRQIPAMQSIHFGCQKFTFCLNLHCWPTLGCLFVSWSSVMGSGSGTAWPTIVGPKTLDKLETSIFVSGLWATLDKETEHLCKASLPFFLVHKPFPHANRIILFFLH